MKDTYLVVPIEKLLVSERNTRQPKESDPDVIELAGSMREKGQLTDILARPHPKKKGCFEIAAGSRRRTAAPLAKLTKLSAKIREMDDDEFESTILVENFVRVDPDPKMEAQVIERLIGRGLKTAAQLAAHLGKKEDWAQRRLRILKVIPEARKAWQDGDWNHFNVEMMEFIGSLPEPMQKDLLEDWQLEEYRSRKDLEEHIEQMTCKLSAAPFDLNDPRFFEKNCGPGCASDSSKQSMLFDFKGDNKKKCGQCLNPSCFFSRTQKYFAVRYVELCGDAGDLPIISQHNRDEIQIGKKSIKPTWDYYRDPSSKEIKGGTKVILLDASRKMSLAWLPEREEGRTSSVEKSVPRSDKEKRKDAIRMLQGKRWCEVQKEVVAALEKATLADLQFPIDDIVAAVGLPFRSKSEPYGSPDNSWWPVFENRAKGFPLGESSWNGSNRTSKIVSREESLLSHLKIVLNGLIPLPNKVSDAEAYSLNYIRVSTLIGFDAIAAKARVDLQIRPPKSWGAVDPHTFEKIEAAPKPKPTHKIVGYRFELQFGANKPNEIHTFRGGKEACRRKAGMLPHMCGVVSMTPIEEPIQ